MSRVGHAGHLSYYCSVREKQNARVLSTGSSGGGGRHRFPAIMPLVLVTGGAGRAQAHGDQAPKGFCTVTRPPLGLARPRSQSSHAPPPAAPIPLAALAA